MKELHGTVYSTHSYSDNTNIRNKLGEEKMLLGRENKTSALYTQRQQNNWEKEYWRMLEAKKKRKEKTMKEKDEQETEISLHN